ncbi:DNA mismatch repair endonuclease MutL [Shouchella lonarensis]|uniref:DNA mismatch repair protein MutL n=1 Tax=Shouchella lonarensis TaxID=1464122 RepID=A0A1G6HF78_9BACI|nr:DNA mismatch repair endonuclease MutL [Shouchella lonarensis]SDB92987.1 DNA mismatch repair protein MutL [Shouchella lonarensis]
MAHIQQLDATLSNKIAAGEVVERPASIVKELVENAIDAESTHILVEIEEGGLQSIRIVDNGIGIAAEEIGLAFARHATSKIQSDRDLFTIRTLGFRGEALPSIASVARVELQSSTGGAGAGIVLEGGKEVKRGPAEARRGTTICVTDLFYNTPARLKYLKTVSTEAGHISDVINRMALAYPGISFQYVSDGKTILQTSGNGDLRQVIAQVYGRNTAHEMIKIDGTSLDYEITGYIARPMLTRASRQYMSLFINGRYIRNFKLAQAIQQGFHTLLPIGRYPIAVIQLKMDPILIDVNVHPAKLEVRLSKEEALSEVITTSIKQALRAEALIPEPTKQSLEKKQAGEKQLSLSFSAPPQQEQQLAYESQPEIPRAVQETASLYESTPLPVAEQVQQAKTPLLEEDKENADQEIAVTTDEQLAQPDRATSLLPTLYPVGQVHGTYIIAQNEQGMYLIDQHAAQERIKYEYFRAKLAEVAPETQAMLAPLTMEFTNRETLVITESIEKLEAVGVFLTAFGKNTFIVRAHPVWFPSAEIESLIREMVAQLLSQKQVSIADLREEAAILMSCKAAIKANHHLRDDEMMQLLETLQRCEEPFTCPHGRPVVIHFSTYELEKMFKRVM